ncbi:MAG: hypothetical protein IKT04_02695 [Clostridia bacterium]|nr:hypothetical protein [Clostridia bacterium]MBR6512513.1 hypothetical protein [Clostridia bacterium]
MERIDEFKTKVFVKNTVYLKASDVAKVFGYDSVNDFDFAHPYIVKRIEDMPELVEESDFNSMLLNDASAMNRLKHIEITRIDTLRSLTENIKNSYPLELLIAGDNLRQMASQSGYDNVEEFLEKVDFPEEIQKQKENLISKSDLMAHITEKKNELDQLIDYEVLNKYGLTVQYYIHIDDCGPFLESFIVGPGVFYSVYDSDYAYDLLRIENSDLIIPTYDAKKGEYIDENYGHDPTNRNYKEYSTLENLFYLITNKNIKDAAMNLLYCEEPGIDVYISSLEVIKLLNPNMYKNIILVDGYVDFDYQKIITGTEVNNNGH